MYLCQKCGRPIAVTSADPVVDTKLGKMHYRCTMEAWEAKNADKTAHVEEVREKRSEQALARHGWAPGKFVKLKPEAHEIYDGIVKLDTVWTIVEATKARVTCTAEGQSKMSFERAEVELQEDWML